ncbi:MAG: crotonobetainyl-CoA--carnitine CoA-transferase [Deltaproteobacteria bacterium]|nr:crotonobetainyl-CoA--carnitine CoA-transferase [Deltaproteobacteria bacterium]
MLIQTKIQIDQEDYLFIKNFHKELNYKSQSDYMRSAIKQKVKADQIRLRAQKREQALNMIGEEPLDDLFESTNSLEKSEG